MLFFVSGEGSSDIGYLEYNGNFKKGAMTHIIDVLCMKEIGLFPEYHFVPRVKLSKLRRADKRKAPVKMPESKKKITTLFHEAWTFAEYAYKENPFGGVILFRDCDRNAEEGSVKTWEHMCHAMDEGFKKGGMKNRSVPMIPNPRSEVWFLVYYQKNLSGRRAYDSCGHFENMSGNDASPKSVKKLLASTLRVQENEIYHCITEDAVHAIEWDRVDMPSFKEFSRRLNEVIGALRTGTSV